MANNSASTNEVNTSNTNINTTVDKLKDQSKQADIDSIHKQLVKTNSKQDFIKEDIVKRVHDLETEKEVVINSTELRTPSMGVKLY